MAKQKSAVEKSDPSRLVKGSAILLVLLTLYFVFWPQGPSEFLLWDDQNHLILNPFFKSLSLRSFVQIWSQSYDSLYIPLTYSLWLLPVSVARAMAGAGWAEQNVILPFQILNLLCHLVNGFLVYLLFLRIAKSSSGQTRAASFLGALIFLFHPVQVESVVWASGFKELIWVTFALLGLLQYLQERRTYGIFIILSYLCKPTAAVLPLILFTLGPWREGAAARDSNWSRLQALSPWFLLSVASLGLTKWQQADNVIQLAKSWPLRIHIALDAIGFYLEKLIWPISLAPDYGRSPHWVELQSPVFEALLGVFFLMAAVILFWRWKSQRPAIASALALGLVPILPVLGFAPFLFQNYSTVGDRYLYFPMIGFAWAVVQAVLAWPMVRWAVALLIPVLATFSQQQAMRWRTNKGLFEYTVQVNPQSFMAENNLGALANSAGHYQEGLAHFRRAADLNPRSPPAVKNIAANLVLLGQPDQALQYFSDFIQKYPGYYEVRADYGALLMTLGKSQQAVEQFQWAARAAPEDPTTQFNVGQALWVMGRKSEALTYLKAASELLPTDSFYAESWRKAEAEVHPAATR